MQGTNDPNTVDGSFAQRGAGEVPGVWVVGVLMSKVDGSAVTTTQTISWRQGCSEEDARKSAVLFAMESKPGFRVDEVTAAKIGPASLAPVEGKAGQIIKGSELKPFPQDEGHNLVCLPDGWVIIDPSENEMKLRNIYVQHIRTKYPTPDHMLAVTQAPTPKETPQGWPSLSDIMDTYAIACAKHDPNASLHVYADGLQAVSDLCSAAHKQDVKALELAEAKAAVCMDLHDALGVKWGDNPYSRIEELKKCEQAMLTPSDLSAARIALAEKRQEAHALRQRAEQAESREKEALEAKEKAELVATQQEYVTTTWQNAANSWETNCRKVEKERDSLRKDLQEIAKGCGVGVPDIEEAKRRIIALKPENDSLKTEVERLNIEFDDISRDKKRAQAEAEKMREQVQASNRAVGRLNGELTELRQELEQRGSGWVSVTERMPTKEDGEKVIWMFNDGTIEAFRWDREEMDPDWLRRCIRWMPIPPLPPAPGERREIPTEERVPLGPEDVPPGSAIRPLLHEIGWYAISDVAHDGLWFIHRDATPRFMCFETLMSQALIKRPNEDWKPCWKAARKEKA